MKAWGILAALAAFLCSSLAIAPAAGALAVAVDAAASEAAFFAHINAVRARDGKAPLTLDAQASDVARAWSGEMARTGQLSHNPNVKNQVQNWKMIGENVGTGSNVVIISQALENSPAHRANIVNGLFTHVGVGVVETADGTIWVTEVFKQARTGVAPATAAPVAPKPAAAPRPTTAPRPRTAAAPKPAAKKPAPVAAPTTVAPAPPPTAQVLAAPTEPPPPKPAVIRPANESSDVPGFERYALNGLAAALLGSVLFMLRRQLEVRRAMTTIDTFHLGRGRPLTGR